MKEGILGQSHEISGAVCTGLPQNPLFHWETDPILLWATGTERSHRTRAHLQEHRTLNDSRRSQGLKLDKVTSGLSHREQLDQGSGGLPRCCCSGDTVPAALGSLKEALLSL